MKNSSTPFNTAAITVAALFAAAALWVFFSHGFDLVVLVRPDAFGDGIEGAVDRYVSMTRATQRLAILSSVVE